MKILPSPATGLCFILAVHALVLIGHAQRASRPAPTTNTFPGRPGGDPNIRGRDFELLEREARRLPPKSAQRNPLAPQLKEDFARIQIISRDYIAANLSREPLDYKSIANHAAEIKKRAGRLRSHLLFPEDAAGERPQPAPRKAEESGIKTLMSELDRSILSFALNPIFKNPGVLDMPNSAKAKSDLDRIIEFSDLLRKEAGKKIKQD